MEKTTEVEPVKLYSAPKPTLSANRRKLISSEKFTSSTVIGVPSNLASLSASALHLKDTSNPN